MYEELEDLVKEVLDLKDLKNRLDDKIREKRLTLKKKMGSKKRLMFEGGTVFFRDSKSYDYKAMVKDYNIDKEDYVAQTKRVMYVCSAK